MGVMCFTNALGNQSKTDALPSPKLDPRWALFLKQKNYGDLRARSQLSTLKGVEGRVKAPG
jgi:hypothetical protein